MAGELKRVPESVFWRYVNERYAIYLRRRDGEPKPWTRDNILRDYKFTNVFRDDDEGTKWLMRNMLDDHRWDKDRYLGLTVFNVAWYRMFNWIGTAEALSGWQTEWDTRRMKAFFRKRLESGEQVFTGAHIIYSEPGRPKADSVVEAIAQVFKRRNHIASIALETNSLEAVFNQFMSIHCIGPFLAHEFVIDLANTRLLEDATDLDTWSNAGPGAMRGLKRLGLLSSPPAKAVESMRYLLERSKKMWKYPDRPWHLHQVEFNLCELSKYAKVMHGEGRPRSTYPGRKEDQ